MSEIKSDRRTGRWSAWFYIGAAVLLVFGMLSGRALTLAVGPSGTVAGQPANAVQPVKTGVASLTEIERERERADRAELQALVAQIKSQIEDRDLALLNTLVALIAVGLGGLITTVIVFFSFRITNEAKSEARNEARTVTRDEIRATREDLERLHVQVEAAQREAEQVSAVRARIQADEVSAQASIANIRQHEEAAKGAIDAFNRERQAGAEPGKGNLPAAVTEKLVEAERDAKDTAQNRWTVDQFKSNIIKALWSDGDHARAESLASDMLMRFPNNDDVVSFANEALGDAAVVRKDWPEALARYDRVIAELLREGRAESTEAAQVRYQRGFVLNHLERLPEAEAEFRSLLPLWEKVDGAETRGALFTRHELAHTLLNQGRAGEAEVIFRELLSLREEVEGVESPITLASRHELARAVLDQGRADEAEGMLREMLPLCEKVEGAESPSTLATRHVHARAVLDQGRAADAERIFRELLSLCEKVIGAEASLTVATRLFFAEAKRVAGDAAGAARILGPLGDQSAWPDWSPRIAARLAFVRGKVADDLGNVNEAATHLAEAKQFYKDFPIDFFPRCQLEDYLACRTS